MLSMNSFPHKKSLFLSNKVAIESSSTSAHKNQFYIEKKICLNLYLKFVA